MYGLPPGPILSPCGHTGSRASPAHPPTGSALRWLCGTRSNHVVSRLSYMPLAVRPVSNYGPPSRCERHLCGVWWCVVYGECVVCGVWY